LRPSPSASASACVCVYVYVCVHACALCVGGLCNGDVCAGCQGIMVGFSGENAQELVKAALSVGLEVVALVATVAQVRTCHDVSVLLDTLIPDLAATTPCCYNTLLLQHLAATTPCCYNTLLLQHLAPTAPPHVSLLCSSCHAWACACACVCAWCVCGVCGVCVRK